jgi:hypothetical protein
MLIMMMTLIELFLLGSPCTAHQELIGVNGGDIVGEV